MSLTRFTLNPRYPSLWRDFDELFKEAVTAAAEAPEATLTPAADVVETEKAVEIHLDLPGVVPEQIDVKLEGNQLTITAERKVEKAVEQRGYLRRERPQGAFTRSFTLPTTLDGTKPEASYRHGVLTVTLPKKEEVQPRSLKVKVEA
jgi:HSP20 family protein